MLEDNPEILFSVIEKHPDKFMESVQKAARQAQQKAQESEMQNEQARMEEELKNPKQPEIGSDHAIYGNKSAPITIVEYSDFQCPYCQRGYNTMKEVFKKHGDKVRFVFKNLPLPNHPMAMPAAKRFVAISMQSHEKAYKFHDMVFEKQERLNSDGEKFLDEAATKAGANIAKMKKDMASDKVDNLIKADTQEANKYGISGTPGFVVGGVSVKGAYPLETFDKIIEKLLKK